MSKEFPDCDKPCEECGAKPAWDFPWAGVLCAKCAGLDRSTARKRRAKKRAQKKPASPVSEQNTKPSDA